MKPKEMWDRLLFLISVPKCVYCKAPLDFEDKALCKACFIAYTEEKNRECSRCHKLLIECTCSNSYLERKGIKHISKCFRYMTKKEDSRANSLIYSLKQDYRRDTIELLANEMTDAAQNSKHLLKNPRETVITFIPRRKRSYNKYGYDHAEVLGREVAKRLSLEFVAPLKSLSRRAQKETSGDERMENAKFTTKRSFKSRLDGKTVILIDDIVTTGASFAAAAGVLKRLGAKRVFGLVSAIAYKDSPDPPLN